MFTRIVPFALYILIASPLLGQPIWSGAPGRPQNITAMTSLRNGTIVASNEHIIYSTNLGRSFEASPDTSVFEATVLAEADGFLFAGTDYNVFRSSDGGRSFQDLHVPNGIKKGTFAQSRSGKLLGSTSQNQLILSTNAGSSWSQPTFPANISISSIAVDSTGMILLGSYTGLWWSSDDGVNWTQNTTDFSGSENDILSIVVGPFGDVMIATVSGVFHSTSGNTNFTKIGGYDLRLTGFDSKGIFYGEADGFSTIYFTTDGGQHWGTASGYAEIYLKSFITAQGHSFVAGKQFWEMVDTARSFFQPITGLPSIFYLSSIEARNNGEVFIAFPVTVPYLGGFGYGIFHSTDYGESWSRVDSGIDQRLFSFCFGLSGTAYACTDGGIYKSTDDCKSWQLILDSLSRDTSGIYALAEDANGDLYSTETQANGNSSISTDGGHTWRLWGLDNIPLSFTFDTLVLGWDKAHKALILAYCSSDDVPPRFYDCAHYLWQSHKNLGFRFDQSYVFEVGPDGTCYQERDTGRFPRICWSGDSGKNWYWGDDAAVYQGLDSLERIPGMAHYFECDGVGNVYLAGARGVFQSIDNGKHWRPFMDTIHVAYGDNTLAMSPDGTLYWYYTGDSGPGYLKHTQVRPYDATVPVPPLSPKMELLNVYPSIVTTETTVNYTLLQSGVIMLDLVNESGIVARSLFRGMEEAGIHSQQFDLSSLPTGLFFLRLRMANGSAVKAILHE